MIPQARPATLPVLFGLCATIVTAGCVGMENETDASASLAPLTAEDVQSAALPGELGCSFSTPQEGPFLLAMGVVASDEPAAGLIKPGETATRISAPGGFDAMLGGAAFSGEAGTVRVVLSGPATGGGESPPRPASLTYEPAGGAPQTLAGRWECGP
ncbi:hypothetical protein [Aureimonas mangrovi]|uniref:hypothetical protein n=1 Tax=Aureimonas mangrovi TaxID=2758041 RepID=UPI00163D5072|nr:hypothetical protein [Aureimonas mangrovi]